MTQRDGNIGEFRFGSSQTILTLISYAIRVFFCLFFFPLLFTFRNKSLLLFLTFERVSNTGITTYKYVAEVLYLAFSGTMASSVPSANGFVVVTHVYPQQGVQAFTQAQNAVSPSSSLLGKFLKGHPAALGTVQIMIGVVVFLFGIVTAVHAPTISVYSGIMFWGAIIYITAGSLTVRADKNLNPCLVKASLGMNIISTITAGVEISMHSLDLAVRLDPYFPCYGHYNCYLAEDIYLGMVYGIAGVMLAFSILEFIVSICVATFACKATCSSGTQQVIYQASPSFPTSNFSASPVNTSETHLYQSVTPPAQHSSASGLKVDS